ncbi:MAG: hypothetical protein H0W06_00875 [Chloroflexia bacterium]|nr:hypothetical protein [Chloroflexia bacterium]
MSESQTDRPRFGRLGKRPLAVYGVLAIGVTTLLLLLVVIYFTASEQDAPPPVCTTIDISQAETAILNGEVARVTVVYDDEEQTPTSPRFGPVQARIEYTSNQCAYLPQGVSARSGIYAMLGLVDFYNSNIEGQSVAIAYQRGAELPVALFQTPTLPPTPTNPPTETPMPTSTQLPATPVPTREPTTPRVSPEAIGTPASPIPATPIRSG